MTFFCDGKYWQCGGCSLRTVTRLSMVNHQRKHRREGLAGVGQRGLEAWL